MKKTPDRNLVSLDSREHDDACLTFADIGRYDVAESFQDALKITNGVTGALVSVNAIYGGTEDCIDINNKASHISIYAKHLFPRGKYVATIKGGVRDVYIKGMVHGHGTEVDIDIGNISDQSDERVRNVRLDLIHAQKEPIVVRVINGDRPVLVNQTIQEYKVIRINPTIAKLFVRFVAALRKLKLL